MLKKFKFWQDLTSLVNDKNTATEEPVFDIWHYAEPAVEEPDPLNRNVLQWRRAISSVRDPLTTFPGQPVNLVGFVQRMPTDKVNQFALARRVIRCCLADTVPLGLPVYTTEANQFETDSWLHVRGVFSSLLVDGKQMLVIEPRGIELISEPKKPYINGVF